MRLSRRDITARSCTACPPLLAHGAHSCRPLIPILSTLLAPFPQAHAVLQEPEVVVHEAWGLRAQEKPLDRLGSHVALLCQGPATGGGKLTEQSPFPIYTPRLGCLHQELSLMTNTGQDLEATNFLSPGHSLSSHPKCDFASLDR